MTESVTSNVKREKILGLINSVIKRVSPSSTERVYDELRDLKKTIQETRNEIGMARAGDIKNKDIPVATDELDAVVEATSEATGKIMDSCDAISNAANAVGGDHGNTILDEVTKIYEACSFQDITGQRIKKVVRTLSSIEERVEKLIAVLGDQVASETGDSSAPKGDAALLNGPQMPANAISQDDIDKLLAELG